MVNPSGDTLMPYMGKAIAVRRRPLRIVYDIKGYYAFLGVSPNASESAIKAAIRQKAKETHPDNGGDPDEFLFLQEARQVLLDEEKRAQYDAAPPWSRWLSQRELQDIIVAARLAGDTDSVEEVLHKAGVSCVVPEEQERDEDREQVDDTLSAHVRRYAEQVGCAFSFLYDLSIPDTDALDTLFEWLRLLLEAGEGIDWDAHILVGMKAMTVPFEVEGRSKKQGAVTFWFAPDSCPSPQAAEVALAFAIGGGDYSKMLLPLGKMKTRDKGVDHEQV